MDTPNCANAATDMASIRSARDSKRILRILNHLARSSFGCPVLPCCCGLRGSNGDCVDPRIPRRHFQVCALQLTFSVNVPIESAKRFSRDNRAGVEKKWRGPKQWTRADRN